jgi:hypothetical protein
MQEEIDKHTEEQKIDDSLISNQENEALENKDSIKSLDN